MTSSDFELVYKNTYSVIIRDKNTGRRSVTNDAESVVKDLYDRGILQAGQRLFYYDSDGRLDEIGHLCGEFTGFRALGKYEREVIEATGGAAKDWLPLGKDVAISGLIPLEDGTAQISRIEHGSVVRTWSYPDLKSAEKAWLNWLDPKTEPVGGTPA